MMHKLLTLRGRLLLIRIHPDLLCPMGSPMPGIPRGSRTMRKSRLVSLSLILFSVFCIAFPQALTARQPGHSEKPGRAHVNSFPDNRFGLPANTYTGGIKEEIPDKYKDRYLEWKSEFLSTDTGRNQWSAYE